MSAFDRRMLVLQEAHDVLDFPQMESVRAFHVRCFRAGNVSRCSMLAHDVIDRDLQWLAREGYMHRVAPAMYRLRPEGRAMVELLRGRS